MPKLLSKRRMRFFEEVGFLCRRRTAKRGIAVYLLVDGAGTGRIPDEWQQRFDAAGMQWQVYNPLGRLGLLRPSRWRRLHRKLCVVDGQTAQAVGFCGGINILDDLHDPHHGALGLPRFDFSMRIQGPLTSDIYQVTLGLWARQRMYRQLRQRDLQAALSSWQRIKLAETLSSLLLLSDSATHRAEMQNVRAALLIRDNLRNRKRIEQAYLKAIGEAQSEIVIANAYFLPGGKLRRALLDAAKRGVKIKLLLQGRYEYFMQYHASRPVYNQLLKAGVEIHEYSASFLHAKVAVVDADSPKAWATVGSSNLDPLSLLLAKEANVVVQSTDFAQNLRTQIMQGMTQGGKQVTLAELAARPLVQRLLDHVAFGLMRFALSITGRRY